MARKKKNIIKKSTEAVAGWWTRIIKEFSRGSVSSLSLAVSVGLPVIDRITPTQVPTGSLSVIGTSTSGSLSLTQLGLFFLVMSFVLATYMSSQR